MCGIAVLIDYSRSQCHDLPVDRAVEAAGTSDDAHSQLDEGEGPTSSRLAQIAADASHKLRERGPDAFNTITIDNVTFLSSVLGLRGQLTPQPLVSAAGNVLCFNGEIFDGLEVASGRNDTRCLLDALEKNGIEVLKRLRGPFAIVYYESSTRTLFYARDTLGRRSLVTQMVDGLFSVSSVGLQALDGVSEIQPGTIFSLHMDTLQEPAARLSLPAVPVASLLGNQPDSVTTEALTAALKYFRDVLTAAMRVRLDTLPLPTTNAARLAVLFSGGLDSAVLARLADQLLPLDEPIDLLNVAFESPRTTRALEMDIYDVPDRLTARLTLAELRELSPSRNWRLHEINVTYAQAEAVKPKILDLLAPATSEMDLSIGLALYFAASGPTTACALLSGLGADEALGGYLRHRRAFERQGWDAMGKEMHMDLERIGTRNCGRDDRIIASHGKEVRYPFLDEDVLDFLATTSLQIKCDPRLGEGQGDKRLLRELARSIGLRGAASLPKRAMQFGSRSAKREHGSGRAKGTDVVS